MSRLKIRPPRYTELIFLLILVLTMDMSAAFAQGGLGGRGGGQRNAAGGTHAISSEQLLAELSRKLHLNEGQKAEVLPAVERLFKKLEQMQPQERTARGSGNDKRHEQAEQLLQKTEDQIADFLSDEQLDQFQQFMAEKMKKKSGQRQGRGR